MDWLALRSAMPRDGDLPARAARLAALSAVLDGRHYDHLPYAFSDETSGPTGDYVPLRKRRPSVRFNLCRTVVDDAVSLLFSEGHFPAIHSDDEATREALAALVKERRLNELMIEAATRGSVGSVAILLKVLRGKPFFEVLPTAYLTPAWNPEDPEELVSVTERYKVKGAELVAQGYRAEPHETYWFQRRWDADAETWFLPWPCAGEAREPVVDAGRTVAHGLGFCPVVWIRNLPGGDGVDGACTFEAAIDTSIELEYHLSQTGRALKYAADPKLVVRDPGADKDRPISGGAASAIVLTDPQAEAKFLEISGSAAGATMDFVRMLRTLALEAAHGNRADADKLSAAQSGRAMELMNQGLVWLADRLRISYGEGALLSLLRMVCAASSVVQRHEGGLLIAGKRRRDLRADGLVLAWPRWYAPTAEDRKAEADTLSALVKAAIMSRRTAIRVLAATYDVEDVEAEAALIEAERRAAAEAVVKAAAPVIKDSPAAGDG